MFDLADTPWRCLELSERRGVWCLVDADDWDWISAHRWNWGWHNRTPWKFYAKRNTGAERSTVYLHREVLLRVGPPPLLTMYGDHLNGQSLDNRKANLGWATPKQNNAHALRRGTAPTLETIIAGLLKTLPARVDMPF